MPLRLAGQMPDQDSAWASRFWPVFILHIVHNDGEMLMRNTILAAMILAASLAPTNASAAKTPRLGGVNAFCAEITNPISPPSSAFVQRVLNLMSALLNCK